MDIEFHKINLHHFEIVRIYLFGNNLRVIHGLMILMLFDILTGWAKAIKNKNLWSRKSLFGLARKMATFCVIIVANIIDQIMALGGGLVLMIIIGYVFGEALSILENLHQLGVPIPKSLVDRLAIAAKENDGKGFTTVIKEEFTLEGNKDLPGREVNVKVKVQPERISKINKSDLHKPRVEEL